MKKDFYTPPKHVAVRFPDKDTRLKGERILFAKTQEGIGLRHGIHIIWEKDLIHLDRAGIKYVLHHPKSNKPREIYKSFGVSES